MATRTWPVFARVCLAFALVTVAAGCGAAAEPPEPGPGGSPGSTTSPPSPRGPATGAGPDRGPAVWTLAPGQSLQGPSTRFTALVSRLDCNGGVTGQVLSPDLRATDAEIVVTFFVAPKSADLAPCPANEQVSFDVVLGEPLRGRVLVDGQCLPGGPAVTTSHCTPDGIRFKP